MTQDASNAERYHQAGVNIAAGKVLVDAIRPFARATARPGANGEIGGFGGLFDLREAGYRDPILVAATDGVGTKLQLIARAGQHEVAGRDVVAMCVNDLLVQGAEPLLFLDYLASAKIDSMVMGAIIRGIAEGCREAGCALVGGESAEMPGHYRRGDYDVAGFALGAAERGRLLPSAEVEPGDVILGLASSGVHANGFSLVRQVMRDQALFLTDPAPFAPEQTIAEALLIPTRIYVRSLIGLFEHDVLRSLAHITGGGLIDNLPRVLPEGSVARIDAGSWQAPPVFLWLYEAGNVSPEEMLQVFNCGIGMVAVVRHAYADAVAAYLAEQGETVYRLGEIIAGEGPARVRIDGLDG